VDAIASELAQHAGTLRFLVGGQRGVDTWAALAAMDMGVPLTVVLPQNVEEFTADWSADDRAVLEQFIAHAGELKVIEADEPARAYSERNRQLATQADLLVAVWAGIGGGGTAETIDFARASGTPVREVLLEPNPTADSKHGRGI
jgi:uncharacterized phage-like protein YoqJ